MDREGEYTFSLRPRSEKYAHRVLCEVTVQDNVKVVTIRSTYKVENQTLYPLEVMLVNEAGQPTHSLEKIGMTSRSSCMSKLITITSTRSRVRVTYRCCQP